MRDWTLEEYQSLGRDGLKSLSKEDFHAMALKQKEFFPDLLKLCSEEGILEIFYRQFNRKL